MPADCTTIVPRPPRPLSANCFRAWPALAKVKERKLSRNAHGVFANVTSCGAKPQLSLRMSKLSAYVNALLIDAKDRSEYIETRDAFGATPISPKPFASAAITPATGVP